MLSTKYIRSNTELVFESSKKRNARIDIKKLLQLDYIKKNIKLKVDELKNIRKKKFITIKKYKSYDIDHIVIMKELLCIKNNIKKFEVYINKIKNQLDYIILNIPNILHNSVPYGVNEKNNQEICKHGLIKDYDYELKSHEEVLSIKPMLNINTASKIAASRFMILEDKLSNLHRALISFMLDTHVRKGYKELYVPYMVNSKSLYGTSQLPKFYKDLFKIKNHDLWLIPTSEVSVTNIISNEIIDASDLPLKFVCHSSCFRSEAGAYGKDKKGIFRQHQFEKVELVKIVEPETSYQELEYLKEDAEDILKKLELPYRIVNLCSGDIGFGSAKTYDIEVWLPSQKQYKEISSCSNFESFQSLRMNSKYRKKDKSKSYVHTINGSALPIGRTLVAIIENYQDSKGDVKIPEVLKKYMLEQYRN